MLNNNGMNYQRSGLTTENILIQLGMPDKVGVPENISNAIQNFIQNKSKIGLVG